VNGTLGPIREIAAKPQYLDVSMPANTSFSHPIERGHTAFAYLFEGAAQFEISPENEAVTLLHPQLVIYGDGDIVEVRTGQLAARFLLVSGKPLGEPVARYGPFVMNTRAEIEQALQDLRNGTFIREQPSSDPDQWYGVE
jgi:redox-sensitive bicupin YhaK (pirin superfamily)